MGISASGVGSGMDIQSLVQQLVEVERSGAESLLDSKESTLNSSISAIGTLKSEMSTFQESLSKLTNPADFIVYSSTSSDEDVLTLSADDTAQQGSFDITVTQLAEAHKLATASFADYDTTEVGTGNLTISNASGDSFDLNFAGGGDNTLVEVRDSINNASDNIGVTATIINIDDGSGGTLSKLIINSNDTGTDNALTLTADPSLSALDSANLATLNNASNAIIQIDDPANTFTSSSNKISGAIAGIELDIQTLGSSTVSVTSDPDGVIENVQAFVDAYNTLQGRFTELAAYNDGDPGPLFGDSTARSIRSQLSSIISDSVSSSSSNYNSFAVLGITTNELNQLTINETNLKAALSADFDAVSHVFTASDGITSRMDNVLEEYTKFSGLLDTKKESLNTRLSLIDASREKLDYRLGKMEARLTTQFIAMDGLVQSLNSTGTSLLEQLANLPG